MSRVLWLLTLPGCLSAALADDSAPQPYADAATRADVPLNAVFGQSASISFTREMRLKDALERFHDVYGVQIFLRDPDMADIALRRRFPAAETLRLTDVPLTEAVQRAADLAGLNAALIEEAGQAVLMRLPTSLRARGPGIQAALNEETALEFPNTPLRDALAFLAVNHDINIVTDEATLDAADIDTNAPVDLILSGLPLRSALGRLLDPFDLTYAVVDDVLLITTQARAAKEVNTQSYNLSDLPDELPPATVASQVASLLEPRPAPVFVSNPVPVVGPYHDRKRLVILPIGRRLIVTASWSDHNRILAVLAAMRGE